MWSSSSRALSGASVKAAIYVMSMHECCRDFGHMAIELRKYEANLETN